MMKQKEKRVGIADYKIAKNNEKLVTIGLGSCVGIALLERDRKIAALIHILLPDSTKFQDITNPYKFADLAIPSVIKELVFIGCRKDRIVAKIAGGASMFNFSSKTLSKNIGELNVLAVKKALLKEGIRILGEDVGGNKGRSLYVYPSENSVMVKVVGCDLKTL